MKSKPRTDDFLLKTHEHLKNKVLPQVKQDSIDFPPKESWDRIIDVIEETLLLIEAELKSRETQVN